MGKKRDRKLISEMEDDKDVEEAVIGMLSRAVGLLAATMALAADPHGLAEGENVLTMADRYAAYIRTGEHF